MGLFISHPLFSIPQTSCGLSTFVFALDEPDSIGSRVSGYQDVRVDFFLRFLGFPGRLTRVSYIPMGSLPHLRRRMQSLRAHDGRIKTGRRDCWE